MACGVPSTLNDVAPPCGSPSTRASDAMEATRTVPAFVDGLMRVTRHRLVDGPRSEDGSVWRSEPSYASLSNAIQYTKPPCGTFARDTTTVAFLSGWGICSEGRASRAFFTEEAVASVDNGRDQVASAPHRSRHEPPSLDASRSMDEDASDDERDFRPAFDAYDLLFVIDVFVSTQMSSSGSTRSSTSRLRLSLPSTASTLNNGRV